VSDSPHLVETRISLHSTGTRGSSVAYCTYCWVSYECIPEGAVC
jgi:hypothetical protein